jgi:hypothetical protein
MVKADDDLSSTLHIRRRDNEFPFLGETSLAKYRAEAAVVARNKIFRSSLTNYEDAAELVVFWRSSHWCCIHVPVAVRFWRQSIGQCLTQTLLFSIFVELTQHFWT